MEIKVKIKEGDKKRVMIKWSDIRKLNKKWETENDNRASRVNRV